MSEEGARQDAEQGHAGHGRHVWSYFENSEGIRELGSGKREAGGRASAREDAVLPRATNRVKKLLRMVRHGISSEDYAYYAHN